MSATSRRNAAAIIGLSLQVSLASAGWNPLNSGVVGPLYAVHFPEGTQVGYAVGSTPDTLGGVSGVVVKTTDRGSTWVQQTPGTRKELTAVYFKDNNTGFAVGAAGTLVRTTDGGATWDSLPVSITDDLTGVQFPENGQIGYIFVHPVSPPSKALKTTDGGENWTAINVGGPASVTRGGGFANDTIGVIVGDNGLVLGTTDGLASTHYQGAQTNADLVAVAFSPNPNKAYLIGNDSTHGVIRYTADGGATLWDSVRCWTVPTFYGVDMPTSGAGFVCGSGGNILTNVSPTDFWRTSTGVTADMHGLCFPTGHDTGYAVGAGGVILWTCDGGGIGHWVAEEKGPAMSRTGIRVVSNPSRRGIAFDADKAARVVVLDATGRVVASRAATKGLNFLPLSKAGVYVVKVRAEGFSTTRKFVVER